LLEAKRARLSALFQFYFTMGAAVAGGLQVGSKSAYEYLPDSVSRFPDQEQLAALSDSGIRSVRYLNLTGGLRPSTWARSQGEIHRDWLPRK